MAKKPKPAPTVDSVLDECRKAMRKGLGKKPIEAAANKYWEDGHRAATQAMFDSGKVNWDVDKKRVLPTAKKLGSVAKVLAGANRVELWVAEAAHEAVKKDPGCPGIGRGGFCDF